jgi:Golgi phosphoprotein 3 (GPP34)
MNLITSCAMQSRHRDGYKLAGGMAIDSALAGAGFVEALIHGKVRIDNDALTVIDRTSSGDPLVDEAVAQLGRRSGKKAIEALGSMTRTFPREVDRILREQGVVTSSWGRFMLVLPYRATRATDPKAWDEEHDELVRVLRGDTEATERHVAVLHLLRLAGVSPRAFSSELGGADAVVAATDQLGDRASTHWPRLSAALDLTDAASRRLLGSGDAAAAMS